MKAFNSTLNLVSKKREASGKPAGLKAMCGLKSKHGIKAKSHLNLVSKKQAHKNYELSKIEPPKDGLCELCHGLPDFRGLSKHHVIFKSHCGNNLRSNLLWLCGKCHDLKHGIFDY